MRKTVKQLWNGETVAMPNGRVKINKAWNLFPHFVFQICFRCCSIVIFLCDRSAWSQVVCGSRSTKSLWHNLECLILPLAVVTSRVSHTMYYPSFLTQFCCLMLAVVFLLIFIQSLMLFNHVIFCYFSSLYLPRSWSSPINYLFPSSCPSKHWVLLHDTRTCYLLAYWPSWLKLLAVLWAGH